MRAAATPQRCYKIITKMILHVPAGDYTTVAFCIIWGYFIHEVILKCLMFLFYFLNSWYQIQGAVETPSG